MKKFGLSCAALSVVLLLAGCGGSAAKEPAGTSDGNVLRVGMECNYAPFNWSTTEQTDSALPISSADYCDGYDVAMARKLAETMGKDVQIVKLDWDNLILSLQNDQIDAVIAGMTENETRAQQADFTTPYYVSEEVVIVRKDSAVADINDIQELSGYKVVGQMNTIYDTIIDQIDGVEHVSAASDFPAAINGLQSAAVDAVTSELPVAIGVCEANPNLTYVRFEQGHGFDANSTVSIAVKKGRSDLLSELQTALDGIGEQERTDLMMDAIRRQPSGN